jgi:hypothetical protein
MLGKIYKESSQLVEAEKCLETAIELKDHITRRQFLILNAYLELGIISYEKKEFQ